MFSYFNFLLFGFPATNFTRVISARREDNLLNFNLIRIVLAMFHSHHVRLKINSTADMARDVELMCSALHIRYYTHFGSKNTIFNSITIFPLYSFNACRLFGSMRLKCKYIHHFDDVVCTQFSYVYRNSYLLWNLWRIFLIYKQHVASLSRCFRFCEVWNFNELYFRLENDRKICKQIVNLFFMHAGHF